MANLFIQSAYRNLDAKGRLLLPPEYRDALLAAGELISFVDSITAPLSMVNALLVAIGRRMGKDVTATFAQLEDIWGEYGVFGKGDDE